MSLNERKQRILKAVIDDYINYAEPIGSRQIAKNHDISLSSATIRNELADLEDLGYLVKTHTSSGRVPSNLGYRTYVDTLMKKYLVSFDEFNNLKVEMEHKIKEVDYYIKQVVNIVSKYTNLPAIALTPDYRKGTLKKIEIMMLDEMSVLIILVTDTGAVKSQPMHLNMNIDTEFVNNLKKELNEKLCGVTIDEISYKNFSGITDKLGGNYEVVSKILEFVYITINDVSNNDIYVGGETNVFDHPEFKSIDKAKDFLNFIHDKDKVIKILKANAKDNLLNIVIGDEGNNCETETLSMVLSPYKISENIYGVMGVIGPTRMDYGKAVSTLTSVTDELSHKLGKNKDG